MPLIPAVRDDIDHVFKRTRCMVYTFTSSYALSSHLPPLCLFSRLHGYCMVLGHLTFSVLLQFAIAMYRVSPMVAQ
jgi:hypothetical protein